MSQFEVGKIYNTLSGHAVRIVDCYLSSHGKNHVRGSDGHWRYDDDCSAGLMFDTKLDISLSLMPPPPPKQPNINLLIDELVISWATKINATEVVAQRIAARAALESAIHQLQKDSA